MTTHSQSQLGRRSFVLASAGIGLAVLTSCMSSDALARATVSGGGSGKLLDLPKRLVRSAHTPQPVQAPATAASEASRPARPNIVARSTWGGTEPEANHYPMPNIGRLTVHHTGANTRALGATDLQTVQRIEDYHRETLGWACIGYHFLIGYDGTVYEGRPLAVQGAHVRDHNEGNLGVSLIGNYDQEAPSPDMLASLRFVLDSARQRYHLPSAAIHGHRDFAPTTCPGDQLYAWLCGYRQECADTTVVA
ncbi:MAG: N-acetylmuramoyl-L-alanine amidase [Planctomycetota bacterium]|nr:N-acetylmuramoyl-L-alanine amidase [Planctomycetota bacterium]